LGGRWLSECAKNEAGHMKFLTRIYPYSFADFSRTPEVFFNCLNKFNKPKNPLPAYSRSQKFILQILLDNPSIWVYKYASVLPKLGNESMQSLREENFQL
jgi:hypothetical protein